jgi:hypothetical protein
MLELTWYFDKVVQEKDVLPQISAKRLEYLYLLNHIVIVVMFWKCQLGGYRLYCWLYSKTAWYKSLLLDNFLEHIVCFQFKFNIFYELCVVRMHNLCYVTRWFEELLLFFDHFRFIFSVSLYFLWLLVETPPTPP